MRAIKFLILVLVISFLFNKQASAQLQGEPVFKRIAIYTGLGGVAGAGVSILWWITDPLSPNNNFREGLLIGFGIGCIVGYAFGVYEVYQKTVPPAIENQEINPGKSYQIVPVGQLQLKYTPDYAYDKQKIDSLNNKQYRPVFAFNFNY